MEGRNAQRASQKWCHVWVVDSLFYDAYCEYANSKFLPAPKGPNPVPNIESNKDLDEDSASECIYTQISQGSKSDSQLAVASENTSSDLEYITDMDRPESEMGDEDKNNFEEPKKINKHKKEFVAVGKS